MQALNAEPLEKMAYCIYCGHRKKLHNFAFMDPTVIDKGDLGMTDAYGNKIQPRRAGVCSACYPRHEEETKQ